jgi:RNA polymerase sigma factor (sigma-70 family)
LNNHPLENTFEEQIVVESIEVLEEIVVTHQVIRPVGKLQKSLRERPDDKALWEAFNRGQEDAFMAIYEQYFQCLCDFGVQLAPLNIVEDAVQDMFVDLRKKRGRLPILKSSIKLFLFQCLKRRLFNMLKKVNKKNELNDDQIFSFAPSTETLIILEDGKNEQIEKLDKALAGLSQKQREAIYYYFYQNMSYDEVKELLGYEQVKSARSYIYKIIKSLRNSLTIFL